MAPVDTLRDKSVLIVDDNRTNRNILKKQLKNAGMNVTVLDSAEEALALLEDAAALHIPFDLAITDLHMPVMNGLALAAEIRKRPWWDPFRW